MKKTIYILGLYFLMFGFLFAAQPPAFFVVDENGYTEYDINLDKGQYIIAPISGVVSEIGNTTKNGKLKFIELKNSENKILVRLYYIDADSIRVKVGDQVFQGGVIAKIGDINSEIDNIIPFDKSKFDK